MDLSMSGGDDADQDHLRHPLGKTLPVRKGERRTPRTAEDQPAVDREVFAEPLDISNQMVSCVGRKIHRIVARMRNTSTASPLVKQDDPYAAGSKNRRIPGVHPEPGPPWRT